MRRILAFILAFIIILCAIFPVIALYRQVSYAMVDHRSPIQAVRNPAVFDASQAKKMMAEIRRYTRKSDNYDPTLSQIAENYIHRGSYAQDAAKAMLAAGFDVQFCSAPFKCYVARKMLWFLSIRDVQIIVEFNHETKVEDIRVTLSTT